MKNIKKIRGWGFFISNQKGWIFLPPRGFNINGGKRV